MEGDRMMKIQNAYTECHGQNSGMGRIYAANIIHVHVKFQGDRIGKVNDTLPKKH